jgi:hypothetical protein
MTTLTLRIPLIVTADGKWAVCHSSSHAEPDWSSIDEMCDYDNPTNSPHRFWIETTVDVPQAETIKATVVADGQ